MHCFETLPLEGDNKTVKLCPVDDVEIKEMFQDRSALLEIIKIKVFCFFRKNGCPWEGMIFDYLEHVKNQCKFSVQWQLCEFSIIGCEKKGSKKEVQEHIIKDSVSHLSDLGKVLSKASSSLEQFSSVCESISITVGECSKRFEEDSDSILAVQTSFGGLENRKESLKSHTSSLQEAQDRTFVQCKKMENYASNSNGLMTSSQDLSERFSNLEAKIRENDNNPDPPGVTLISNSPTSIKDYGSKLNRLERDRKTRRENLADSDLKIRLFQATTTDGRYMWKIDNYPRRMKEAKEGKIVELYSPPLYSHVFGYKLCCKIYLNGKPNESCHGTHVSFYMVLMKGQYDATLRFPFPRIFRVTLLGRNSNWNVEKKIEPSNTEEFQKPKVEMNMIVGHSMFISHKDLSSSHYLWGDSLFFKIDFTEKSPQFAYSS